VDATSLYAGIRHADILNVMDLAVMLNQAACGISLWRFGVGLYGPIPSTPALKRMRPIDTEATELTGEINLFPLPSLRPSSLKQTARPQVRSPRASGPIEADRFNSMSAP